MSNALNRFSDAVSEAIDITTSFLRAERQNYGTDRQAIGVIARKCKLTPSVIRRFIQPSRRPKDVSATVLRRLEDGYIRFLRHQLETLRHEIARLEALGGVEAGYEHLLAEARDLVVRLEAQTRGSTEERGE